MDHKASGLFGSVYLRDNPQDQIVLHSGQGQKPQAMTSPTKEKSSGNLSLSTLQVFEGTINFSIPGLMSFRSSYL